MNEQIKSLVKQIRDLENQLEVEFTKQREKLRFGLEHGRVVFEEEILRQHKALKIGLARYVFQAKPLVILTAPVIYSVFLPLVLLDMFVTIYQSICFPVYGISKVKRADHFIFDRHRLAYLNGIQKLNCVYCSYANGLICYVREIAGRTEQYWCPIKHSRRVIGAHANYPQFVDYGDAESFEKQLPKLRKDLGSKR
ncbi:MAG: hypothetical protein AB3N20_20625 [Rhizobiaceae bacterium]